MPVDAATRIALILGHPIEQVRAPALFNALTAELGRNVVLVPVDVAPDRLAAMVTAMRGWANLDGCIATVPHKRAMLAYMDRATERARRLGAVNVVRRRPDGSLSGDILDGQGFLAAARAHGFSPVGKRVLLVGAGAAGSAIADALCAAGVAVLDIEDIDDDRVRWLCDLLAPEAPGTKLEPGNGGDLSGYDLIVNASSTGMRADDPLPIAAARLATVRPGILAADVVTGPDQTPFLIEAARNGCALQRGAAMAEHQIKMLGRWMGSLD